MTSRTALSYYMIVSVSFVIHASAVPYTFGKNQNDDKHNFLFLDQDGLFEGDIKTSEVLICEYYSLQLSSIPGGEKYCKLLIDNLDLIGDKKVKQRALAATAFNSKLWTNAEVPYHFSSSTSNDLRHLIRQAMDHWEDFTCLRFIPRNGERDYVEYDSTEDACWSFVGKHGGNQTINVVDKCEFGKIVHEIGHAIGFWHEHSRPDRDDYVRINDKCIKYRYRSQFMKRDEDEVNSQDSEYDYGSIMHYPPDAFATNPDCNTIELTEYGRIIYEEQGNPQLGQREELSETDIQQANTLYSCPKRGVTGSLRVRIRNGQSLPSIIINLDGDIPDPYHSVQITAVDSSGTEHIQSTIRTHDEASPTWNENLEFPNLEWQFFRIQIWGYDIFGDRELSISETVVVSPGAHINLKHYSRLDSSDNGYVNFDYSIE